MQVNSRYTRKHRRVKFIYPVAFKILSPDSSPIPFKGFFEKISMSGAGINFEDRYGLIKQKSLVNARIKIEINIFEENQIILFARVQSVINSNLEQDCAILIGVEFEELEDWQLEIVERIVNMKGKAHKMMWNLWDTYVEESN